MAKRKPQMIYILEKVTGPYDDRCYVPIMAFKKLKDAEAERDRLQKEVEELYCLYGEIITDIDDIEAKMFRAYLKETNPDLYKKVTDSESPYDYDSDEYQDSFINFETNDKAEEFLYKSNLTEQEIYNYTTCLRIEKEYGWDKPYFLVSHNPIELR